MFETLFNVETLHRKFYSNVGHFISKQAAQVPMYLGYTLIVHIIINLLTKTNLLTNLLIVTISLYIDKVTSCSNNICDVSTSCLCWLLLNVYFV